MAREVRWIFGGLIGVLALLGLALAAHAHDLGVYYAGLLLSACATLFIFFLIKQAYDRSERHGGDGGA